MFRKISQEMIDGFLAQVTDWFRTDKDFLFRVMPKYGHGVFSKNQGVFMVDLEKVILLSYDTDKGSKDLTSDAIENYYDELTCEEQEDRLRDFMYASDHWFEFYQWLAKNDRKEIIQKREGI